MRKKLDCIDFAIQLFLIISIINILKRSRLYKNCAKKAQISQNNNYLQENNNYNGNKSIIFVMLKNVPN